MNYDEKIKQLENIIDELNKDIPMEQALEQYKNGVMIVKDCLSSLEETKGTIYKVKQELDEFIQEKMK